MNQVGEYDIATKRRVRCGVAEAMDMTQNATQLSALSRLFSSSVYREMAMKGCSPLFARLFGLTGLSNQSIDESTVGAAFDAAFSVLRNSGFRDEYVFRAALTHNILLGRHSLNTTSMLTEFRAGSCKADLVILNGTSTVYEIKSDRDSLTRLANQISNYRKVFAKIYVIAGEAHVHEVLESTSSDIGVMSLAREDRIRTVREAADRANFVCPKTIFDSLRLEEARSILRAFKVSVPDVPNTMLHSAMRDCFSRIEPAEVHSLMVKTLKKTRTLAPLSNLVEQLPESLKPAALSVHVRRSDHEKLLKAVRTPLSEAIAWA